MEDSHYEVQKVEIRNNIPLEEAKSKYKRITKRNAKKVRETKQFYHFRLQPPTRFVKGSFRSKKVNNDIILIVGELKPEFQHLSGGGFGDYFKRAYSAVSGAVSSVGNKIVNAFTIHDYSTKTKRNLELYGDLPVVALEIRRKPLNVAVELAFQGVSAGQWAELKKKYGFDKFYHLSAVVTLKKEDTKQMAFEKLEVISFNDNVGYKEGDGTEILPVEVTKPFTVVDMFNKTRKTVGDDRFFSYSGVGGNNCQDFIAMCLTSVGLYGAEEKAFTYQDMKALTDELPLKVKAVARGVTQIGAIANKFLGIGGSHEFFNEEYENEIPHSLNSILGGMRGTGISSSTRVEPIAIKPLPRLLDELKSLLDIIDRFETKVTMYDPSEITDEKNEKIIAYYEGYSRLFEGYVRQYESIMRRIRAKQGKTPDKYREYQAKIDESVRRIDIDIAHIKKILDKYKDVKPTPRTAHTIKSDPYHKKLQQERDERKKHDKTRLTDPCSICLTELSDDKNGQPVSGCVNNHIFHRYCIEDCKDGKCPLCKSPIKINEVKEVDGALEMYGGKKSCWKGYEKKGTKIKNGKVVNNCIPIGSAKPDTEQFLEYVKEHQHDLEGKHTVEQMYIDFKEKLAFEKQQVKNAKRIQKIQDGMKEPKTKEDKALKEQEKEDKKALKEQEKAEKKAEKEREKEYKKSLKEQEKEYKKSLKEQEKAHKKAEKAEKKGTKMEEREEIEADDTLYPWYFKGKTYLKNIYDEVYLRGYKGGVGEWVGVFDGEYIDNTIPEPEYDEPAVPEPETDPALDKKPKVKPEKSSKYLTRNTWIDAKGKKVKFMYNGKKETGTLLFWQHPTLMPGKERGSNVEFIKAVVRTSPTSEPLFVPVFEDLKNVAKMKLA